MTPEDRYTDGTHRAYHPSWHREDAAWKALQVANLLRRRGLAPGSVVDVGCGTGAVLAELGALLPDATRLVGYDVAADALDLDLGQRDPRLDLRSGSPDPDEHHDLALCIDVLEHVEDYLGFLRSIQPLASLTILHIPLDTSVQSIARVDPLLDQRSRSGHLHYFTRETALAAVKTADFEVLDFTYTRGALERPPQSALSMAARFPRRALFTVSPDLAARWLGGFSLLVLAR